jgi:enoyl-CoA hydratase/carnithine racemase
MTDAVPTESVLYEEPAPGIARIVLNRPEAANAQDKDLLYKLNDAFDKASHDTEIRVIILAANGLHFSSGHDLRDRLSMRGYEPVSCWGGYRKPGAEGVLAYEEELFLGMCWRWRNLPKPTIAAVHGLVIAGGLMLMWPCDLVVSASDAVFADPVVALGVNGVEYFAHPWELGPRRAKQMLFTGEHLSAEEAHRIGMVNYLVEPEELDDFTLELANKIASRPTMAITLAKQAVNQSVDAQGFWAALQGAMSLHQLGHAHNKIVYDQYTDPEGADVVRQQIRSYR